MTVYKACQSGLRFGLIGLTLLCGSLPAFAQSSFYNPDAPPSADQETGATVAAMEFGPDQVCLNLDACLNILERHAPDSFDYSLLAEDFERYGAEGQDALLALIFDAPQGIQNTASDLPANRALDILARQRRLLSPKAQRKMVALWASLPTDHALDVDLLAAVLTRHLSPMVRAAAIDSLQSRRTNVRDAAHVMLTRLAVSDMDYPLRPGDLKALARDLQRGPHPGVVGTIAKDRSEVSAPILASILAMDDGDSAKLAYQSLYTRDREDAFRVLVSTLYGLKSGDGATALALSDMLRQRHATRDDGFYMAFARDLSQDPEMSVMGRMAGFDAIIRNGETVEDTELTRQSYQLALSAYQARSRIPDAYFDVLSQRKPAALDGWLAPLSRALPQDDLNARLRLTQYAGQFDTPLSRQIARSAMAETRDYRLVMAGLLTRTAQSEPSERKALAGDMRALAVGHPVTLVRQAATLAIAALSKKNPRKALQTLSPVPLSKLHKSASFCKTGSDDFAAAARPMPYFDGGTLLSGKPARRGWLTTAARYKDGWIAGYDAASQASGADGALLAYNTRSGQARPVMPDSVPPSHHRIHAIVPFETPKLGRTASGYWVLSGGADDAAAYRVMNTPRGLNIRLETMLPRLPQQIKADDNGSVIMGFGRMNPPLRLARDTGLSRYCAGQSKTSDTVLP